MAEFGILYIPNVRIPLTVEYPLPTNSYNTDGLTTVLYNCASVNGLRYCEPMFVKA